VLELVLTFQNGEKLSFRAVFFSVTDRIFFKRPKKLSHFGHDVRKHRLENTVTASFNTSVRQTTEMSQRKKNFRDTVRRYNERPAAPLCNREQRAYVPTDVHLGSSKSASFKQHSSDPTLPEMTLLRNTLTWWRTSTLAVSSLVNNSCSRANDLSRA